MENKVYLEPCQTSVTAFVRIRDIFKCYLVFLQKGSTIDI